MHSSTFNSKYKFKIIGVLLISLLLYLLANITFYLNKEHDRKINEKQFSYKDDVNGRFALLKQLYKTNSPDIVFVGNSMTREHISTHAFYQHGIHIFNYGINGYYLPQYLSIVRKAIKAKPKIIVISLFKEELYIPISTLYKAYDHDHDIDIQSLYFFGKRITRYDHIKYFIRVMAAYFINLNYFFIYSHDLNVFITETYNHFNTGIPSASQNTSPFPNVNISLECDFDNNHISNPKNCNNGDDALIGVEKNISISGYKTINNIPDKKLNSYTIRVINGLIDEIKNAGIQPVIVFVPGFKRLEVNNALLQKSIQAPIVDMAELNMPIDYWHDYIHYNIKGRNLYSNVLAKKMDSFLK